jgi:quercetin dioxygenase-like cupin family protein
MMTRYYLQRLVLGAAIAALALVTAGGTFAQDATPAAQPVTDTVLAMGMPNDAPGMMLQAERVTIAPGAAIPSHIHPGAYAIYVESGLFGFTVTKGEAELTRAGSTSVEMIAADAEVIAQPGDSIFENGGVVHSARNAGDTPVVVLTAALLTAHEPSLQPTNDAGTPVS